MATKAEELRRLERGDGPLAKAADDEPVFILRGQDLFFLPTLYRWTVLLTAQLAAGDVPDSDATRAKRDEVRTLIRYAKAWQERNYACLKVPD